MLDTTIGMLFCIGVLKLLEITVFTGRRMKYRSGNYYDLVQVVEEITPDTSQQSSQMQSFYITQPKTIVMYIHN